MSRRFTVVALVFMAAIGGVFAQPGAQDTTLRFKWQVGQILTYKVGQQTVVQETTLDEKTEKPTTAESRTALALTRKWMVKSIDTTGNATLEMQITELKTEIRQADGSTIVRDSTNPEHAKEMADYLNKPVVTIRIDSQGRLIEVSEAKQGSAARLHAELPFRLTLPDTGPAIGQTWNRTFAMKLDPPLGTGDNHDFLQKYTCTAVKDGLAVIGVQTALKATPKATSEQIPLVPMLWTGEIYFNTAAGRYHAARLTTKSELTNHLGEGTKFVYQSTYSEDSADK